MNHPLLRAALALVVITALALVAGLGLGAETGWAALALGALALLAYHVAKLAALIRWLKQPGATPCPKRAARGTRRSRCSTASSAPPTGRRTGSRAH